MNQSEHTIVEPDDTPFLPEHSRLGMYLPSENTTEHPLPLSGTNIFESKQYRKDAS
jgi:hypothetical protein